MYVRRFRSVAGRSKTDPESLEMVYQGRQAKEVARYNYLIELEVLPEKSFIEEEELKTDSGS